MKSRSYLGLPLALLALLTGSVGATPVTFTVDPSQSQISLSGTVIGFALKEQGTGSLQTSFSGSIVADVTAATIQFPGGSMLDAKTNGVWTPGPGGASAAAPADYAAQANTVFGSVKGALRNLLLDLMSDPLPLTNGAFNGSALRVAFPTNSASSFDYDAGFAGANGIALSGISTNGVATGATVTTAGDLQTLTINIDTEFKFAAVLANDSAVRFTGKLVATHTNLPMITSIQLTNKTVILQVQAAGPTPLLQGSTNLTNWTPLTPTRLEGPAGPTLTVPAVAAQEFYRVAK